MTKANKISVGLTDDHRLFRQGLRQLIQDFEPEVEILWEADNGLDTLHYMEKGIFPDVLILDAHMPQMDGADTATHLKEHYPDQKILVLSMMQEEAGILYMLRQGVRGFISKDINPDELEMAIRQVHGGHYYFSESATAFMLNSIQGKSGVKEEEHISDKELQFLHLASSELTYKEIAEKMNLSVKTVDGYRMALFEKLQVKSRVGLVLTALKRGWVKL